MSVIFFSSEELGNAAAYLARGQWQTEATLPCIAELFAAYSVGNLAAFRYRYSDASAELVPCSVGEILAAATDVQERCAVDVAQARGTLGLLSYNGPEGEGLERFRGQQAYRKAMISILGRAYSKVNRALETKEKGIGWEHGFGAGQD